MGINKKNYKKNEKKYQNIVDIDILNVSKY
jgi:hypothetical protein